MLALRARGMPNWIIADMTGAAPLVALEEGSVPLEDGWIPTLLQGVPVQAPPILGKAQRRKKVRGKDHPVLASAEEKGVTPARVTEPFPSVADEALATVRRVIDDPTRSARAGFILRQDLAVVLPHLYDSLTATLGYHAGMSLHDVAHAEIGRPHDAHAASRWTIIATIATLHYLHTRALGPKGSGWNRGSSPTKHRGSGLRPNTIRTYFMHLSTMLRRMHGLALYDWTTITLERCFDSQTAPKTLEGRTGVLHQWRAHLKRQKMPVATTAWKIPSVPHSWKRA